jgi:hypothetical protein
MFRITLSVGGGRWVLWISKFLGGWNHREREWAELGISKQGPGAAGGRLEVVRPVEAP